MNNLNLIKYLLRYTLVLIGIATTSFAAETSIYIAVFEDPALIEKAPFASRVEIFAHSPLEVKTQLEKDDDFADHGVAVCSVLVGKDSLLPKDTSITLVPSIDLYSSYLKQRNSKDLVILNWSGYTGYPGLSEDVLNDLKYIEQRFATILAMDKTKFTTQVHEYISVYDDMLDQLKGHDTPLTVLLCYAKECLLTATKQASTQEEKNTWASGVSEKIEIFKKHGEEQARVRFTEMKINLLECLTQHDNTLIVWALGNDGENIDNDPFWQDLLSHECILSHTLLIHGVTSFGKVARSSNFTSTYLKHSLGKPYRARIWGIEESSYIIDEGTSFSAPLATIDAFIEAKKIVDQTGQIPSYADIKSNLLNK